MSTNFNLLSEIVAQLESRGYQCEAGALDDNTAFQALKRMAADDKPRLRFASDDEIVLTGQVIIIRHSRIAVVRVENEDGDEWELDVPITMLPEGAEEGRQLEFEIKAKEEADDGS